MAGQSKLIAALMGDTPFVRRLSGAGVLYGGAVGATSQVDQPDSLADAQKQGTLGHLGKSFGRDMLFGLADDFIAIPLVNWVKPIRNALGPRLRHNIIEGFKVFGMTAGATVATHDYLNYTAARQYVGSHAQLTASQQMVPNDPRMSTINGFQKGGLAALQRTQMTGIASPAAGGIFYRMVNNPFADHLRKATGIKPDDQPHNPRVQALSYGWAGGLGGLILGSRMGLGKATLFGLIGGTAAGLYGIKHAHNPDMHENARALGDVALAAAPTAVTAGALYGLASIRGHGAGIGKAFEGAMNLIIEGASKTGAAMNKANYSIEESLIRARANPPTKAIGHIEGFWRTNKIMLTGKHYDPSNGVEGWKNAYDRAIGFGLAANDVSHKFVTKMFMETGKASSSRWEKSLGVGHLLAIAPHQIALGATISGMSQSHRKSKGTTTMPSNRAGG